MKTALRLFFLSGLALILASDALALGVGDMAPDITSTDSWNDSEGKKLSDYRGNFVILKFWGSW